MEEDRPQSSKPPEPDHPRIAASPKPGLFHPSDVLIALVVLTILAAIVVPHFVTYRQRGCGAAAYCDVKSAFTAAQTYFADYPGGTVDAANLARHGFIQTANVTVTVQNGTKPGLSITTKHNQSTISYTVDSTGKVTKGPWPEDPTGKVTRRPR